MLETCLSTLEARFGGSGRLLGLLSGQKQAKRSVDSPTPTRTLAKPWALRLLGGIAGSLMALSILACGDSKAGPNLVMVPVDDTIHVPESLEPGFTTFRVEAKGDSDHHLIFLRPDEGVSQEQFEQLILANDGSSDPVQTIVGGNGGMAFDDSVDVTFKLETGYYAVVLFDEEGEVADYRFISVSDGEDKTSEPSASAVVTMGPGMTFTLPDGFDGSGTYKVVNKDTDIHEPAVIRLEDGAGVEDLLAWGEAGFQGPPPFTPAGGFGALDAGRTGWVTDDLPAGQYALVCWIPDDNGVPHWMSGMIAQFEVK